MSEVIYWNVIYDKYGVKRLRPPKPSVWLLLKFAVFGYKVFPTEEELILHYKPDKIVTFPGDMFFLKWEIDNYE